MDSSSKHVGVTGQLNISFAVPTDDPKKWRLKHGSLTFGNGATVGIDVQAGYIPYVRGSQGLTVTYCAFRSALRREGNRLVGDVAMWTCVNGRVMDANDIADGVEVLLPPDGAAALPDKDQHAGVPARV